LPGVVARCCTSEDKKRCVDYIGRITLKKKSGDAARTKMEMEKGKYENKRENDRYGNKEMTTKRIEARRDEKKRGHIG